MLLAVLALVAVCQGALDFDCPFRQLAYEYTAKTLGGRGLVNVAAGLGLSGAEDAGVAARAGHPLTSSWYECPGKQSIVVGSCNDPHKACEPTSGDYNSGTAASLLECQARCEASSANFSCRAVQWHGPSAGEWAHVCVLQKIAAFDPTNMASHNAACLPGSDFPECSPHCSGHVPPPPPPSFCKIPSIDIKARGPRPTSRGWTDVGSSAGVDVYVDAVHGADTNSGSQASPLKSLHAAQMKARQAISSAQAVTVHMRAGTYYLNSSLTFSAADGGRESAPVVWTNYKDEHVVVSGGQPLVELSWTQLAGGVWRATVPSSLQFNSVFVGEKRAIRARFPNGDPVDPGSGFELEGKSMGCPSTKGVQWTSNVEVVNADGQVLSHGATFDQQTRTITLEYPKLERPTRQNFTSHVNGTTSRFDHTYNTDYWGANTIIGVSSVSGLPQGSWNNASTGVVHMYHPSGWGGWQFGIGERPTSSSLLFKCVGMKDGVLAPCSRDKLASQWVYGGWQEARGGCGTGKFYVENVKELLDSPREWFHDEADEALYYMPQGGADPHTLDFVASLLQNVIEIKGSAARPVSHLTLNGFTVAHAATTFMERYEVPSGGDWSIHRGAALFIEGAENVRVTNCLFDQPGGNALMLSNYVVDSLVANNSFVEVGDSAILAVGSSRLFNATNGAGLLPARNIIDRNLVDTVGVFGKQTAAYFKALCNANVFRFNVIMNGPRSGVNFNDGAAGGEEMVGNLVFNFVRESSDHGMFNSWDRQPYLYSSPSGLPQLSPQTHQIRNNFCFNKNYATTLTTRSGYCVDYDDGSSQYNATDNVFLYAGFKIRDGVNRTFDGNVIIDGRLADPQVDGFNSTTMANNVVVDPRGVFYACVGNAFHDGTSSMNNKFYTPGDASLPFHPWCGGAGKTLAEWQKNGANYDGGSTISADITTAELLALARTRLGM